MVSSISVRELVQAARSLILVLVLFTTIGFHVLSGNFVHRDLLLAVYSILGVGFFLQFVSLSFVPRAGERFWLFTFFIDSLLISGLIWTSGAVGSWFVLLHLINIGLASIVLERSGLFLLAALTGLSFTWAGLAGLELQGITFVSYLLFNNLAFFVIAGLAGFLSGQIERLKIEKTEVDNSLQEEKSFNRVIVDNIPVGLIGYSHSGVILRANPAAEMIFGGPLLGRNVFDLIPSKGPRGIRSTQRFETVVDVEGTRKTVGILGASIGNSSVRLLLIEDLTEIRRLEEESKRNEKLAAIGRLAAGIAHEIRNPLAGISGSVEMLSQSVSSEEDRRLMSIVLREIDRLNNLITEFLEFARPQKLELAPTDLISVLEEVLLSVNWNRSLRSDVLVIKNYPPRAVVPAHRDKLKQALLNIVINAWQAMAHKKEPRFEVSLVDHRSYWELSLKDNGPGMSPNIKQILFEPFFTTKEKGTGLGLALTHKILEMHGANLEVLTAEGEGADFRIRFPKEQ
ncbi:MAG: ATP-binding protein [Bdellovibrionaceae bacterium]|nr:ATP-binding protein [Pseudobdellovibrionaceae bacterium]